MKEIDIMYGIVGTHRHTVDLDEYEEDILDRYGKPWDELTNDEKLEFVYDIGIELLETADAECYYSLGTVEGYEDGDEDFWL